MLALRVLIVEEEPVKQSDWRRKTGVQYSQILVEKVFQGGESDKMMLVDQVRLLKVKKKSGFNKAEAIGDLYLVNLAALSLCEIFF